MAKRYKRKSMKKIEPAVQTITLGIGNVPAVFPPGQPTLSTYFVDLSQIASVVNRRAYRQGINWAVAGLKVTAASGTSGDVRVKKLPNTWIMSSAWEKSMRAWLRMSNEAMEETPSVRPRFMDFKIYANSLHHNSGFGNNVPPLDADGNSYTMGEWEASKMIIPDSSVAGTVKDVELIAVGANYPPPGASGLRAVSVVEGYANSRALPNVLDPNTPNDADDTSGPFPQNWIGATFNQGTEQSEEVLDDLTSENNIAPYPFENDGVHIDTMYPGPEGGYYRFPSEPFEKQPHRVYARCGYSTPPWC